jgi:hypothetical protein
VTLDLSMFEAVEAGDTVTPVVSSADGGLVEESVTEKEGPCYAGATALSSICRFAASAAFRASRPVS